MFRTQPEEFNEDLLAEASLDWTNLTRPTEEFNEDLLAEASLDWANLTELQAAFNVELESLTDVTFAPDNLAELQTAFDEEIAAKLLNSDKIIAQTEQVSPASANSVGKMVRVPLEQLKQFNNLFEKLILERNTINLHLKQTQNLTVLMRQRMQQIEQSNTQLKKWYDRASLEGIVTTTKESSFTQSSPSLPSRKEQFDVLEMDRYTELHLVCQEQIETIVQLEEVSTDIELGLQEINQAVQSLNQTTKLLQGNVTRTQMVPFAEVTKRFPRVLRELSIQFGKQVNLKIIGENTLIDRSIIETLGDPLLHLLRNAFDHGIEPPEARVATGKSPEGTITLQALNKGMQTVITLRDDGGGIRSDKIRARLRSLGITDEYKMSDTEVLDFIFEPGFSTAEQVTELFWAGCWDGHSTY